jgi:hypothetical protein
VRFGAGVTHLWSGRCLVMGGLCPGLRLLLADGTTVALA